jgi:hypothetical protein
MKETKKEFKRIGLNSFGELIYEDKEGLRYTDFEVYKINTTGSL